MVIQQLASFEELVNRWDAIRTQAGLVKGYRDQLEVLKAKETSLRPLVESWALLRSQGLRLEDGELSQRISFSHDAIGVRELETLFAESPDSILRGEHRPRYSSAYSRLDALIRSLGELLQNAWSGYVNSLVPSINADLLNVLWNIADFRNTISRISQAHERISHMRQRVPTTLDEFNELKDLVEELEHTWRRLDSDRIPQEVVDFIRESRDSGASLSMYTDEVRRWLAENNIQSSFRIRLVNE